MSPADNHPASGKPANGSKTTARSSPSEPSEVELLLPWYAAGTLNRREAAQVEAALAADPTLAERLEWVRTEFAQEIYINEEAASPPDNDVKALFAKIDALPARRPAVSAASAPTLADRIAEFFASLSPRTLGWSAAAAALVIALQAGVIAGIMLKEKTAGYETTSEKPTIAGDGAYVLIRFQPQATAADIASFLAANKLSIVAGPSGGELFRVRVAATKLAKPELADVVNKLQNNKVIGFIAATE
jgi:anti-sigma factor RsiW